MNNAELTQLLVISNRPSQANQLLSSLRKADFPHKATGSSTEAEVIEQLNAQQWDLVVCFENQEIPVIGVLQQLKQLDLETPLIFICDEDSTIEAPAILRLGASDVIASSESKKILFSIERETTSYQLSKANRQLKLSLNELEKRHQLLLDSTPHAFSYIQGGIHIYCNQNYATFFHYPDTDSIMTTPLLDLISPADNKDLKALLGNSSPKKGQTIRVMAKPSQGAQFPVEMCFTPIHYDGEACLQLAVKPASGNIAHAETVKTIQGQDLLTRLDNRTHFITKIEKSIGAAINHNTFSTLLIIQVNEMLDIKSAIGQSNANTILNDISTFLQQSIQRKFSAARLSDYEFGIILDNSKLAEAIELSSFISNNINNHITSMALPSLQLSSSIGIAVINGHAVDAEDIISRARTNLNSAPAHNDEASLTDYLSIALEQNRFKLLFQPIVNIKEDDSEGYEVLTRMLNSDNNEISPDTFLPLANINGMGEDFDKAVLKSAIKLLKKPGTLPIRLIINITSNSLVSKTFLPWLSNELQQARIPSDLLAFQISEIDICNSPSHAIDFCNGLKELHLPKIVCHFGCAIKPLEYLDKIKPDYIKLDKIIVRDIIYSNKHKNSVKALIDSLHQKGLKVIAPQIEEMSLLPLLWEVGADFVQGFCLQAPSQEMNYEFIQKQEITLNAPTA